MGVFTYSREENTAAYGLAAQVPDRVKRDRRAALMQAQAEISLRKNRDLIGREVEVLVEGTVPGRAARMRGRSATQAPEIDGAILFKGEAEPGEFVRVRITQALTYDLRGEMVAADIGQEKVASHA